MGKLLKYILGFLIIALIAGVLAINSYVSRRAEIRKERQTQQVPLVRVTLIEGWGINDIAKFLEKKQIAKAADFIAAQKEYATTTYPILASKPASADLEGFLFPDTYELYAGESSTTTSAALVRKMLDNFSRKFTEQMRVDAAKQGLSVYEIVTLASIIERETGRNVQTQEDRGQLDEERKIIAGIFYNRLRLSMPLQSDATVNYVTGKNDPQAGLSDTQIDSPYNTYKYKGLPPGPICNPSLSSLKAAIYPTETDYLYFLHTQPEGKVIYSKTHEEHVKNKQKYLR